MTPLKNMYQKMLQVEYGLDKPETIVVLIPVVSLWIGRAQIKTLLTSASELYGKDKIHEFWKSKECKKIQDIALWHVRGSLIQLVALSALTYLGYYLCVIPLSLACYEVWISSKAASKDFDPNFSGKKVEFA